MNASLNDLDSRFKPLVLEFLTACNLAGVPVRVINTLRSKEEHARLIENHVSWTIHSKHLPQAPEGKSQAIDVCPEALIHEKFWAPNSLLWVKIGEIGENLGMRWGGRWKQRDFGHFEMQDPRQMRFGE